MINKQQGFSLIELLIVVSIIGILSAIAIPTFETYMKRSHVTEGLVLAGDVRTRMSEYYLMNGELPSNLEEIGINSSLTGNAVRDISIDTDKIVITFTTKVISGATIYLQRQITETDIQWNCYDGTLIKKYRPTSCRAE